MREFIKILFIFIFLGTGFLLNATVITEERDTLFKPVLTNNNLRMLLFGSAKRISVNFDYSALLDKDTDVLLVGEEHHNRDVATAVNLMIKNLKEKGINLKYVCSEFLLSSEQPYLDAYYKGEMSYVDLKKKCTLGGRVYIAEVAKRYKVRPIGLDLPKAQEDSNWAMSAEGITERNKAWTDIIVSLKQKDPNAKIIVYGGSLHTATFSQYYPTVAQMLKKHNIKTKTVEFVYYKDPLWKPLSINSNSNLLFTIPAELKKYIQADYVVFNIENELSAQDREKVRKILNANMTKFQKDDKYSDSCEKDPDNPICKISIDANRSKNGCLAQSRH